MDIPRGKTKTEVGERVRIASSLYREGLSITQTAKKMGLDRLTVGRYLTSAGVEKRPTTVPRSSPYKLDEAFFETIDSEEKAYWLGFIVADGNVHGNRLTIGLKGEDAPHLERFVSDVGGDFPVTLGKTSGFTEREQCRVRVGSKKMATDLEILGVVPRKSTREVAPLHLIPVSLHRHFWRGVVDGDGTISCPTLSKTGAPVVGLVGSKVLCEQFREWAQSVGPVKSQVCRKTDSVLYSVHFANRGLTHPLLLALYGDCSVALDRKRARALAWGPTPRKFLPQPHAVPEQDVRDMRSKHAAGAGVPQLAKDFGRSRSCVYNIVTRQSRKDVL